MRSERALNVASLTATIAAVVLMGWRQFRPRDETPQPLRAEAVALSAPQTARVNSLAFESGSRGSAIRVIAFSDVQCPFCARFDKLVDSLAATLGVPVEYGLVHFPLPQHAHARSGARALECARAQGRFPQLRSRIFSRQPELGTVGFEELARDAGVADLAHFRRCMQSAAVDSLIDQGLALGAELGLRGTPMVVIDGFVLERPPSATQLTLILEAHAAGGDVQKALKRGGYDVAAQD